MEAGVLSLCFEPQGGAKAKLIRLQTLVSSSRRFKKAPIAHNNTILRQDKQTVHHTLSLEWKKRFQEQVEPESNTFLSYYCAVFYHTYWRCEMYHALIKCINTEIIIC